MRGVRDCKRSFVCGEDGLRALSRASTSACIQLHQLEVRKRVCPSQKLLLLLLLIFKREETPGFGSIHAIRFAVQTSSNLSMILLNLTPSSPPPPAAAFLDAVVATSVHRVSAFAPVSLAVCTHGSVSPFIIAACGNPSWHTRPHARTIKSDTSCRTIHLALPPFHTQTSPCRRRLRYRHRARWPARTEKQARASFRCFWAAPQPNTRTTLQQKSKHDVQTRCRSRNVAIRDRQLDARRPKAGQCM